MYDKALEEYKAIIDHDSSNFTALKEIGKIYFKRRMYQESVKYLTQGLKLNPADMEISLLLGGIFKNTKNYDKARQMFEKIIERDADNYEAIIELSKVYSEQGEIDTAIEILNKMIEKDPGNYKVRVELGILYRESTYLDKAIVEFRKVLKENPKFVEGHIELAQTFLIDSIENNDATMLKEAQERAAAALEIDPKCVRAHIIIGEIHKERGDYDKARESFEQGLKIDPENPRLLELFNATRSYKVKEEVTEKLSLAQTYLERNHIENAIMEYESILEIDPNNYQATFQMADIYINQNLVEKAIKFFQRTKSIKPDFIETYKRLAEIYKSRGETDRFISECLEIISHEPNDPIVHLELARTYMETGMTDESMLELKKVITVDPDCEEAYQNLGQIYEKWKCSTTPKNLTTRFFTSTRIIRSRSIISRTSRIVK